MILILLSVLVVIGFHAHVLFLKKASLFSTETKEFLKPDIKAFLFYGFIRSFLASVVLFGILYFGCRLFISFVSDDMSKTKYFLILANYLWSILSIAALFIYVSLSVKYKKEKYFFYEDKLIYKGGGIFSDFERELSVKHITHVTMMLPFIENKLFKTGYIKIESAGALTSEIFLRAVANPKGLYENIIKIMKKNGFKLNRETLVEQEKPHPLAVLFEVFGVFAGMIFFIGYMSFAMVDEFKVDIGKLASEHGSLLFGGLALLILGVLTFCFFHFLDLKKRIYDLYEDTIAYTEGFLNKNYSFIPIENLADSSVTQSIPSRIFGLYDVKISCQGSGQEIIFKNIKNGETLSKKIDELISKTKTIINEEAKEVISGVIGDTSVAKPAIHKVETDREYKDEYRMEKLRTWMPAIILSPLLIVLFPVGIIVAISNAITVACNVFRVKADTVEHSFSFLSKKTKEFSLDKVTGIVIKESFMDKWCRTCSILFWSIGSGENVTFLNIKKTKQLQEKILAKKGIRNQNILFTLNSSYDIASMIKGNLYTYLILAVLLLPCFIFFPFYGLLSTAILVVICSITFIYRTIYYKKSKVVFYEDYVRFTRGLFFVEDYFVYYDDIKDISTTRFPMSNRGNVKFNVVGERIIQTQNGNRIISNSFTIRFVDNIKVLDELIDTIFYQRPSVEKINEFKKHMEETSLNPVYSTKPCLSNYLLFVLPLVIIVDVITIVIFYWITFNAPSLAVICVLLLFSLIIIGAVIIVIKAISYNIQ
ncbi:MAG: PH domain-containing protein, partial [Spirochaetes bacterium]|nr:PH domain-containing protein [Spirochaetota bacterium]